MAVLHSMQWLWMRLCRFLVSFRLEGRVSIATMPSLKRDYDTKPQCSFRRAGNKPVSRVRFMQMSFCQRQDG